MTRIEGYISEKVVRSWLETYEYLDSGDTPPDARSGNTGPKPNDGITSTAINRIMLQQAIDSLSPPLTKNCCKARWVQRHPLQNTLKVLGISKTVYYRQCEKAVRDIHIHLNGGLLGASRLLDAIIQKPNKRSK